MDNQQSTTKKGIKSSYTQEYRDSIVKIYNSGNYASMAECARDYNIPEKIFYQWIASSKHKSSSGDSEELIQLRKDNKRLSLELEILKKAAAYFAREIK